MNKLYIIRHGKTDWNEKKLIQGRTDIELNDEGINDAKKLSKIIDLGKIDICISSPLKRAKTTADIIVNNEIDIIYDDLLIERCFGDYEGTEILDNLTVKHWNYKLNDSSNNIENISELLNRAKIFLNKVKEKYPDKNILIVSHACIIKAIHFNLVGYDENTDFLSFYPKNTTIYEYILK